MRATTVRGFNGLIATLCLGAGLLACAAEPADLGGGLGNGGSMGNAGGAGGAGGKGGSGGKGGAGGAKKPDAAPAENGGSGGNKPQVDAEVAVDTAPPVDMATPVDSAPVDGPPASGGPFTFTGDFEMMGNRLCHKKGQTRLTSGPLGTNKSPALMWSGVPAAAKSLVVSLKDRQGGTHWIMCNIPVTATGLPAAISMANAPMGATQTNNWYGPGAGNVRPYEYRLWAMKEANVACSKGAYPAGLMAGAVEFKEIIAYGSESAACN